VTFGVLQSGNFGIPQTRLRAFIIAAAPGQKLPQFPEPQNVFEKFSLRTLVDEKGFEPNVRWINSAPYRNVTTREAISDLPEIESGESRTKLSYGTMPESHFQKLVRFVFFS
jgi:DNA (cytosine-5)-methyltransferase 1